MSIKSVNWISSLKCHGENFNTKITFTRRKNSHNQLCGWFHQAQREYTDKERDNLWKSH
jgi:hypothetical protein